MIFSERINRAGYSANILNLGHFFYRYEIQIELAERVTVRPCIGKISDAGYFKSRSRIPINNRAQNEGKNTKDGEAVKHAATAKTKRSLRPMYSSEVTVVTATTGRPPYDPRGALEPVGKFLRELQEAGQRFVFPDAELMPIKLVSQKLCQSLGRSLTKKACNGLLQQNRPKAVAPVGDCRGSFRG